ncbi:MAG: hypothetical protein M1825_000808 [Sarcosagium campestre]|nr:MAG: hypothetical protein M1825_000808 [Sarcosagium campestre]
MSRADLKIQNITSTSTFTASNSPPSQSTPPASASTPLPETFTLTAPPETDIWRKPPSTYSFTAPTLTTSIPLRSFRRARVTVSARWSTLYHQGGLLLVLPPSSSSSASDNNAKAPITSVDARTARWVKTGVEYHDERPNLSTVAADAWADWSLLPLPSASRGGGGGGGEKVTVEIEREVRNGGNLGPSLWVYLVGAEGGRTALREVSWVFADGDLAGDLLVGVYAANPTRAAEQLEVKFQNLVIETTL